MSSTIPLLITGHSVGITGICKNAGKTTVLNALLRELYQKTPSRVPALTSIGRDGESQDIVTLTPKPRIYIHAGTIIATAAGVLKNSDITREILASASASASTALGDCVIIRALSDGFVELAGPSTVLGLTEVRDTMRALGADIVLIDGAINRKAFSVQALCDDVVLCTGASYHRSQERVVAATRHAATLLTLPQTEYCFKNRVDKYVVRLHDGTELVPQAELSRFLAEGNSFDALRINGALTDSTAGVLLRGDVRDCCVVCADSSNILVSTDIYAKLCTRHIHLCTEHSSRLIMITVNPFSAYGAHFDPILFYDEIIKACAQFNVPIVNCNGA